MDGAQPQPRGLGCLPIFLLLGGATMAYGIYQLTDWSYLDSGAKSFAILTVLFGLLLLLPALVMVIVLLVAKTMLARLQRQIQQVGDNFAQATQGAAGPIFDDGREVDTQAHEFREATESDFAGLDTNFYQRISEELTQSGYHHLGDIVDVTIEQAGQGSPPIRMFSSPDGTTTVSCYHVQPPEGIDLAAGQPLLMCDVSCEFSDGTFLITSNSQDLDTLPAAPGATKRQLPLATPIDDLLRSHEAEKSRLLTAKAGVTCVIISTLPDAIESEKRQQFARRTAPTQTGFIDAEQVPHPPADPDNEP